MTSRGLFIKINASPHREILQNQKTKKSRKQIPPSSLRQIAKKHSMKWRLLLVLP